MELFANTAQTTVNNSGTINNSSDPVTFTVTSASLFPATGNFRILIDNEIMLVTSVTGLSFTASRAREGTTIASHADATDVTHILTAASILQFGADMSVRGTFSARPTAGRAGRTYHCTDVPFWYYDDGTNWHKYYGSHPLTTPDNTGYTWDNQSSAVLTTTNDMLTISPHNVSSFRYKTAPSPPYTITAAFILNWHGKNTLDAYLGFRESSSGKIHAYAMRHSSGVVSINSWKWLTGASFDSVYASNNLTGGLLFVKIEDDNTNRNIYVSVDGINFSLYDTRSRTNFLTANQILWGAGSDTVSTTMTVDLIHWKEG